MPIPRSQLPQLLQDTLGRFAREFLPLLDAAYREAPSKAASTWGVGTLEASNNLGDTRHGLIDQAMRRAAAASGLPVRILSNGRNTWQATEIVADPFVVVQARPDFRNPSLPRFSCSRAAGAESNARQGNLFEDPESESVEVTVGVQVVVVHENERGKPGVFAGALVGAYLDLEEGELLMPAVSLESLARGEDFGSPSATTTRPPYGPTGPLDAVEPLEIAAPAVVLRPLPQVESDGGARG